MLFMLHDAENKEHEKVVFYIFVQLGLIQSEASDSFILPDATSSFYSSRPERIFTGSSCAPKFLFVTWVLHLMMFSTRLNSTLLECCHCPSTQCQPAASSSVTPAVHQALNQWPVSDYLANFWLLTSHLSLSPIHVVLCCTLNPAPHTLSFSCQLSSTLSLFFSHALSLSLSLSPTLHVIWPALSSNSVTIRFLHNRHNVFRIKSHISTNTHQNL